MVNWSNFFPPHESAFILPVCYLLWVVTFDWIYLITPDDVESDIVHSLKSSLWMSSAKLGSSPHQKSQSSRRPGVWCRRHTLSTSAAMHRLKLHKMGSSSVTGKRMGDEVGPSHTKRRHLIPVKSALRRQKKFFMWGWRQIIQVLTLAAILLSLFSVCQSLTSLTPSQNNPSRQKAADNTVRCFFFH